MQVTPLITPYSSDHLETAIHQPIVFFDGECVMCNKFVDALLKIDPSGQILIAPLQGQTAQRYLPPLPLNRGEWSIYYLDNTHLYQQSDAFIQVCQRLGSIWSVFSLISFIPRPIRDKLYRLIAHHRYQLLGRRSTCRIPSKQEEMRFLP
jgi:predicted DCC family thiol-disulfide oxidoreductase YuxK